MPDVTFTAARFSQVPLPNAINEVLGHDLAAWLLDGLKARGWHIGGGVIEEDYGYGFWIHADRTQYWVMMSQYEPAQANLPPRWLISVNDDPGCLWMYRLRARPSAETARRLALDIHALLLTEPTIERIEWWAKDVGSGTPTPTPS